MRWENGDSLHSSALKPLKIVGTQGQEVAAGREMFRASSGKMTVILTQNCY